MKVFKVLSIVSTISISMCSVPSLASNKYPNYMEKNLISVCYNAAIDNKRRMLKAVDQISSLRIRRASTIRELNKGLLCNGKSVIDFADYYGAVNTLGVLKKYMPKYRGIVKIHDEDIAKVQIENIDVSLNSYN